MAYDEGLAQTVRDDLGDRADLTERKMFGGLAFMLSGHMVAGVYSGGGLYRVGKENVETALGIEGAGRPEMGGRTMRGMIALAPEAMADDARRMTLLKLALAWVEALPPKS